MKIKTILVTGHAGFIGSSLTARLLADGLKVIGVDNFNDYYDQKQKEENVDKFKKNKLFTEYRIDITDYENLKKILKKEKVELVIHLAARAGVRPSIENPKLYYRVNVKGTENLLKLCKRFKVSRFIFASSSSVYGEQEKIPFAEADNLNGLQVSPYAKTKKEAEELCLKYSQQFKIQMTVLRFFTVYGPKGRPDMAPFIFTKNILHNQPITRFGDGSSSRDYTYIDDIVEGIIKAIKIPFKFEIINLGNNQPVKLNQFIKTIEDLTNKTFKIIYYKKK